MSRLAYSEDINRLRGKKCIRYNSKLDDLQKVVDRQRERERYIIHIF